MRGGISLGPMELVCLLAFGLFIVGVVVAVAAALLRASQNSLEKPAKQPPKANHPPVIVDAESHVDVVASIARRFCPKCRAVLTSDSPEGLCPACLLAGGLSDVVPVDAAAGSSAKLPAGEVALLTAEIPNIEILELLGQGGMGAVYKARQKNLDRLVAVKVIRPDNAVDPSFAERFEREAKALAKLNHPNILTVHDFGKAGDVFFLVMEFIDGVNLRQTMQASRLSPREALAIVPQICDALQYAHDHGVVHRDIKPENVLLDRFGRVKIADFGLAKLLDINPDSMTLTLTQHVVGTPRYMAPEQIERPTAVDHRADIYSLGVVIYEMLTGELPVGHFPLPSERVQVDVKIDEVVLRALAKEPEKRFQKASQVKSHLASAGSWPSPPPKLMPIVAQLRHDPGELRRRARHLANGPAIGLMATGVLGVVPFFAALVGLMFGVAQNAAPTHQHLAVAITTPLLIRMSPAVALVALPTILAQESFAQGARPTWLMMIGGPLLLLTLVPSLLILVGGWQMRRLESYGLAMIAAIMALLPICTLGFALGIPMGIWALTVLSKRDVREAFAS